MNRVEVGALEMEEPSWADRAEAFALKILGLRGLDGWDLSLAFTSDGPMAQLNGRWRGKEGPTDVLSFSMGEKIRDEEAGERYLAGDIVISLDSLAANAESFSVDRDAELKRLIVHGILHLEGLDHDDNDPSQEMLKLQEEILSGLTEERIL